MPRASIGISCDSLGLACLLLCLVSSCQVGGGSDSQSNSPTGQPTANAGPDLSVYKNATVSLDGSASSDPDGDTLTYHWSQTAGETVEIIGSDSVAPKFTAPGISTTLTFSLVVRDGRHSSQPSDVVVAVTNRPPKVSISATESAPKGALVTLDGTGSIDPDGDTISTYAWTQTAGPAVVLSQPNSSETAFTVPVAPGDLTFQLSVTDAEGDTGQASAVVHIQNQIPVAVPGDDQTVAKDSRVTLDGGASYDTDGESLTYSWSQVSGIGVSLEGANTATPSFTLLNVHGTVEIQLIVSDPESSSEAKTVAITVVSNAAPVAVAGEGLVVNGGENVVLDASSSYDPDGERLHYKWRQVAGPAVTLNNEFSPTPEFAAPNLSSKLAFEVAVSDGIEEAVDVVDISVVPYDGLQAPTTSNPLDSIAYVDMSFALATEVFENTLFVLESTDAQTNLRLVVFDVSTPLNPVQVGEVTIPRTVAWGPSFQLIFHDGILYFSSEACTGILRFDVRDFTAPKYLDVYSPSSCPKGIFISQEGMLYVASHTEGVLIIDISDFTQPRVIGSYVSGDQFRSVYLVGNKLYVLGMYIFGILDVSDPTVPVWLSGIATGRSFQYQITSNGVIAALADQTEAPPYWGIQLYDVTDPINPKYITEIQTAGSIRHIQLDGHILYAQDGNYGTWLFDLSKPESPRLVGMYSTRNSWDFRVANGYLFQTNAGKLVIIDVSQPAIPSPTAYVRTPGIMDAGSMAIAGSVALVPDGDVGMLVVDLKEPGRAVPRALVHTQSHAVSVSQFGRYAYLGGIGTFEIFDITNPLVPTRVGGISGISQYGAIWRSKILDERAYITPGSWPIDGVSIIDISDKSNPTMIGQYTTGYRVIGLDVHDGIAYLVRQASGIEIVDVSDGVNPKLLSVFDKSGRWSYEAVIRSPYLFVASGNEGLIVYDASDPTAIIEVAQFETTKVDGSGAQAIGISIAGSKAYVANRDYSVQVVDISDIHNMRLVGRYFVWGSAFGTAPNGDFLLVSDNDLVDPDLLVFSQRPILSNKYVSSRPGTTIAYLAAWGGTVLPDMMRASCAVTGGQCAIQSVDQKLGVATVVWTLPETPGDEEILITVGTQHSWVSDFDRVKVQ